jgi:uncharacterized membrane protein YqaE (UPF0057 family)
MRKILFLSLVAVLFCTTSFTTIAPSAVVATPEQSMKGIIPEQFAKMTTDEVLNMTPREYKKMTGQKLSLKEIIALKAAQKMIKKRLPVGAGGEPVDKTMYIVLAILIPFLAVGLATDWDGNDWIICLVLSVLLCWVGGFIYALVKMKDYNLKS